MKGFSWEVIYEDSTGAYFESTYRAKVIGGWLIRHETCNDYQYGSFPGEESSARYVNEEGWQNVSNVITFISDPNHEWSIG